MTKHLSAICTLSLVSIFQSACDESPPSPEAVDETIQQVYAGTITVSQAQLNCRCQLDIVPVAGTVFHFGLDLSQNPPVPYPFQSTVAGVLVSIAEIPATRLLNVRSDVNGKWSAGVIKLKGKPLPPASFVYELAGYTTTKSQLFEVGAAGITDLAVQFPTEAYFALAKGQVELQIGALIGAPYTLRNVLVTTVGKSWASMYSPELPHGDPGAQVAITPAVQFPASVGPVYFNEAVAPDPTYTSTSVDGGVLFGNLPNGKYSITASKSPFSYSPLNFVVQDGIGLYVASPPHATQGTNNSAAGQP